MLLNENIICLIIIIMLILSGLIGYIIGRLPSRSGVYSNRSANFLTNDSQAKSKSISIDDKKYVVEIKTDGLEKKYESLGDIKKSAENIQDSINKLKNLKR